jgi:hypothetical protein
VSGIQGEMLTGIYTRFPYKRNLHINTADDDSIKDFKIYLG